MASLRRGQEKSKKSGVIRLGLLGSGIERPKFEAI
jgi:hypothetical protein